MSLSTAHPPRPPPLLSSTVTKRIPTLTDPLLDSILTYAIRFAPLTFSTDAINLTRPLNVLPRCVIPLASLAVIARLPWIESNFASLRNDLWLLDALLCLARAHPYLRPLQYHDTKLMDDVSARGFVDVLNWWLKSGLLIEHVEALQMATDNGHVDVLQWWKDSGRLSGAHERPVSLVEATRQGHLVVLDWWLNTNTLKTAEMGAITLESVPAAMYVAFKSGNSHVADWWAEHALHFGPMASERAASVAIAAGNRVCTQALLGRRYDVASPTMAACALMSGDLDWIAVMLGPNATQCKLNAAWASLCASLSGRTEVLDWLDSRDMLDASVLVQSRLVSTGGSLEDDLIQAVLLAAGAINSHYRYSSVLFLCSVLGYSNALDWWMKHAREQVLEAMDGDQQLVRNAQLDACRNQQAATVKWWLHQAANNGNVPWEPAICNDLVEIVAENGFVDIADVLLSMADDLPSFRCALQDNDCNFLTTAMVRGHFAIVDWWIANIEPFPYADLRSELDPYASVYPDNLFQAVVHACCCSLTVVAWALEHLPSLVCTDRFEHDEYYIRDDNGQRSQGDGRVVCHVDMLRSLTLGGVPNWTMLDLFAHLSSSTTLSPLIDFRVHADREGMRYSSHGLQLLMLVHLLEMYPPKDSNWKHDLDRAISSRAGLATLDWIVASGRYKYSAAGYRYALSHSGGPDSIEARWWVKNGLPTSD